jgi:peptidoglycan/LPS O-acetylase OafA/YrhL
MWLAILLYARRTLFARVYATLLNDNSSRSNEGKRLRKDASLEFLRGAAALAVLNGHILRAFAPAAEGGDNAAQSLKTGLAFIAFNGGSAVYLFFVLSSYVLVKRYFQTRKAQDLLLGAIKRLPRLAGPVLVAVLASCIIFKLDLYFFQDAAAITQSEWLSSFGNASRVLSPETASFSDALLQGVWRISSTATNIMTAACGP